MSEPHMKRAAEWFLTLKEIPITETHRFITQSSSTTEKLVEQPDEEPDVPVFYDTGLDAAEGLWLRAGWAGRG